MSKRHLRLSVHRVGVDRRAWQVDLDGPSISHGTVLARIENFKSGGVLGYWVHWLNCSSKPSPIRYDTKQAAVEAVAARVHRVWEDS